MTPNYVLPSVYARAPLRAGLIMRLLLGAISVALVLRVAAVAFA